MTLRIFRNGSVFTSDPAGSTASAVAVRDDTIVAVGGEASVADWIPQADDVVDLGGRMLLPGFVDAHAHPVEGGIERNRCDLTTSTDAADYRTIIGAYVSAHPEATWVLGGGWSLSAFPGGLADRHLLDEVVGERPTFLPNRDHHSAWVSTAALRLAGVDRHTPDPSDGRIERDADGEPTGLLHEGAMDLVGRLVPPDSQADVDAGLRTALQYLNSLGITGWQDAIVRTDLSVPNSHQAYERAAAEGWLTARVSGALWWERATAKEGVPDEVARLVQIRDATSVSGSSRYDVHSVKVMQDGVAETYTASMLEPYLDGCGCATDNSGISFLEPELLREVAVALDAAGFQLHVHALGDKAVRDALDAIEAARRANGASSNRHHLAHLQFVDAADIPRFHALDVAANIQALWAAHDPQVDDLTVPFVGDVRAVRMYPFGELFAAGATLAMGSDWPVSTPDPLQAIHVAVNRMAPGAPTGTSPLGVAQQLALTTVLRAYTAGSASINRRDDSTGTIRAGGTADLVVLDRDPFTVPASELGDVSVDRTFLDGVEVFSRS